MDKNRKAVARARQMGLATLVSSLISGLASFAIRENPGILSFELANFAISVVVSVVYVFFLWGLVAMGQAYSSERMVTDSRILIVLSAILCAMSLFFGFSAVPSGVATALILAMLPLVVALGVSRARLGNDIKELESDLGKLAYHTSKLNRVSGYLTASLVLSPVGLILSLVADVYIWRLQGAYLNKAE